MDFVKWAIRIVCMLAIIYLFSLVGAIGFPFTLSKVLTSPVQLLLSLISIILVALVALLLGRGVRSVKGSLEPVGLAYLSALIVGGVQALLAWGMEPGDRIALFLGNCPTFVVAYLGTQLAGGIVVLVNTQYRQVEL